MHPPFIVPQAIKALAEKYSLHWVTLESSFQKASKKEDFTKYVSSQIRQNKYLSKEVELALIETESKSSAARNKGYLINYSRLLISGWPKKKRSASFLKLPFINPHLILVFTAVRERAIEEFNKLD